MSPRRNRPSRPRRGRADRGDLDVTQVRRGVDTVQAWGQGQWRVRQVFGSAAVKTYRCPGCDQQIRPGVPHVVVWPADGRGDETDRRHWHQSCWTVRDRRSPRPPRPR